MLSLDALPLYELQTMYYVVWKEKQEEEKMSENEKASKAIGSALADEM